MNMDLIFEHPWMTKNAAKYGIDIWNYVYKS
jgi:hypothetical protein